MKSEILKTEIALNLIKQHFSEALATQLDLTKVSAPLAIRDGLGINDDLNGIERPVRFPLKDLPEQTAVVVHSLAKWKRLRLQQLEIATGKGILTDMRALRPDEDLGPLHSIYVDQWDWEKHIDPSQRTLSHLKETVVKIYAAMQDTEAALAQHDPTLPPSLPKSVTFLHTEALCRQYPKLTPKAREQQAAKQYGAVFIMGIGGLLSEGLKHDGRAPDYDDWSTLNEDGFAGLNGDLIVWHHALNCAIELSSMGIRVNQDALLHQLELCACSERTSLAFHQMLVTGKLPSSMGGGIGQSRLCMLLLQKRHIGEVQVGIWQEGLSRETTKKGIHLL